MARPSKRDRNGVATAPGANPELAERKRLKNLALTKRMVSEGAAKPPPPSPLSPSKTVLKHHGKDILKKSQRKNRYLFSFPGLLGPISGGKVGELKDLSTKNPILYLDFPQGQMKLFGTIVYPKNRYLTLQFSKGGKNVTCEDYFDNMIIFSDAWWIGRKDENPDEARLEFPKEILKGPQEYEFKGGAGVASGKCGMQNVEEKFPNDDLKDNLTDGERILKDIEATPVRHSTRTSRKSFNFAEGSSGDDSVEDVDELSEGEQKKQIRESLMVKSNNPSGSSMTKSEGLSSNNHGPLVQATISTLFKKAEVKAEGSRKKAKVIGQRKDGTQTRPKEKRTKNSSSVDSVEAYKRKTKTSDSSNPSALIEEDDIEVSSNTSEEDDDEDEDWAG